MRKVILHTGEEQKYLAIKEKKGKAAFVHENRHRSSADPLILMPQGISSVQCLSLACTHLHQIPSIRLRFYDLKESGISKPNCDSFFAAPSVFRVLRPRAYRHLTFHFSLIVGAFHVSSAFMSGRYILIYRWKPSSAVGSTYISDPVSVFAVSSMSSEPSSFS